MTELFVSALIRGRRPNWGRIAAESFGSNVGHQVVGSAVERVREQQQQRQPQAIRREVAGQNDAVGYRDDGGLQARAETAWRQQERRRQTAIAEVQSLERGADVSLNGEAMLDEIVVTASRLPPGGEHEAQGITTLDEVEVTARRLQGLAMPEIPELTWEGFQGRLYGLGQFVTGSVTSTASLIHDSLYQLGDIASFGVSHHTRIAQQVWARQKQRKQAMEQVLSDPLGLIEGHMERHRQIAAYEAAGRHFDAGALRVRTGLEV